MTATVRGANEGRNDGSQDPWRSALAGLSHLVDGQGAGARLRASEGRLRDRRNPDDGFVLWESMAINLYLAKKYGAGTLYPTRLEDEARAWQWSFWGMTEVERPVLTAMMNRAIYPESQRDLPPRTPPKKRSPNRSACSTVRWRAPPICSAAISRSPISTSPASSPG